MMNKIVSDLELMLGDTAHELFAKLNTMSQAELAGFADAMIVIHSYLTGTQDRGMSSSAGGNGLTPEEVDEISHSLEA